MSNRVDIEVHTNSFRGVRGRSLLLAIFDEVAFWGWELLKPRFCRRRRHQAGTRPRPGSRLILISSAHKRSGLLYERWKEWYGRNDDVTLVVRGSTTQFNATFDAKIIEQQLAEDRALFGAEYLSEWRDDLATLTSRQLLEAAVDSDVIVRPPQDGIIYFAFDDPSGGAQDSYTLAIAHQDARGENVILDLLYERFSPMNPYEVTTEIAVLLRYYRCTQVTGGAGGAANSSRRSSRRSSSSATRAQIEHVADADGVRRRARRLLAQHSATTVDARVALLRHSGNPHATRNWSVPRYR